MRPLEPPNSGAGTPTGIGDNSEQRLQVLLLDYEMIREDERVFFNVLTAMMSVGVALLGGIAVLIQQTCLFNTEKQGCWPFPQMILAWIPIIPFSCIAYIQVLGILSVVRTYYMRSLEAELQTYSNRPLSALGFLPPASYMSILNEITSLSRGRASFRALVGILLVAATVLIAGITVYFAIKMTEFWPRFFMAVFYIPLAALLAYEFVSTSLNGRALFRGVCESYFLRRHGSGFAARLTQAAPLPSRNLPLYLAFPRPDELTKASISPALVVTLAFASSAKVDWKTFAVLWICYELLLYPARYQWNDIRGYADDIRHPERAKKVRLPVVDDPAEQRTVVIATTLSIAVRLLSTVTIAYFFNLTGPAIALIACTAVLAIAYEALKTFDASAQRTTSLRVRGVWVTVGLGYAIRASIAIIASNIALLETFSPILIGSIAALGIMVVLMIWTLDGASYCTVGATEIRVPRTLMTNRPQIGELLSFVSSPLSIVDQMDDEKLRNGATERVLEPRGKPHAPWNLAGLIALAGLISSGIFLPGRAALPPIPTIAGCTLSLLLFLALVLATSTQQRLVFFAACSIGAAAIFFVAPETARITAPTLATCAIYVSLRRSSYSEIILGPRKIIGLAFKLLAGSGRLFVGRNTWNEIFSSQRASTPPPMHQSGQQTSIDP